MAIMIDLAEAPCAAGRELVKAKNTRTMAGDWSRPCDHPIGHILLMSDENVLCLCECHMVELSQLAPGMTRLS